MYQNGGRRRARGVDLGLQYQFQTSFGTFTSLTQATYLDSFRQPVIAGGPPKELSNSGSFDSTDALLKWKAISRLGWDWRNLELVATCRFIDGFHEILFRDPSFPNGKKEHWVGQTWFFDVQATYDFVFAAPVESQPVAGYSKGPGKTVVGENNGTQNANYSRAGWKSFLNDTSITIGCNDVFGQDPPKAYGEFFTNPYGYPGSIYDSTGRFVYVSLTKKF